MRNAAFGDNLMAGRWYTEGVEDGLHLQSVVANNPDGTFVKTIRNGTDCQAISTWIETGTWTFDGKHYVETTETVKRRESRTSAGRVRCGPRRRRPRGAHRLKTLITWTFAKVDPNYTMSPPKDCTV